MLHPNQRIWKEFTAWLKQHDNIDTSKINEKCGVEIVGTKLNKTKKLTERVSPAKVYRKQSLSTFEVQRKKEIPCKSVNELLT